MSNTIGYGASAIRAGEVRYQESLANLMKQTVDSAREQENAEAEKPSEQKAAEGHKVDIRA